MEKLYYRIHELFLPEPADPLAMQTLLLEPSKAMSRHLERLRPEGTKSLARSSPTLSRHWRIELNGARKPQPEV